MTLVHKTRHLQGFFFQFFFFSLPSTSGNPRAGTSGRRAAHPMPMNPVCLFFQRVKKALLLSHFLQPRRTSFTFFTPPAPSPSSSRERFTRQLLPKRGLTCSSPFDALRRLFPFLLNPLLLPRSRPSPRSRTFCGLIMKHPLAEIKSPFL